MAFFLAKYLGGAGHQINGIWGRNIEAATSLANEFQTEIYDSLGSIIDEENHFCFIAIKDTAIESIASQLSFKNTVLVHTAGASSIGILDNAALNRAVFWPIYSITKENKINYRGIPIAVEGNSEIIGQKVLKVAQSISEKAFVATESQRAHLHLAAVFANNFCNHLLTIADEICSKETIPFDYLKPIIEQTFERLKTEQSKNLQTGPAIRDDKMTMQKHLKLLKTNTDWALVYESLSASIRKMYGSNEE